MATLCALLLEMIAVGMTPGAVRAKVGQISFDQLAGSADVIVLVRVDRVEQDREKGLKLAYATPLEWWKGASEEAIVFRASPSWTCDITEAVVGESALLFLDRTANEGYREVLHSGRGRMPVTSEGPQVRVEMWTDDVRLPADALPHDEPETAHKFIRDVSLEVLRGLVREATSRERSIAELAAESDLVVTGQVVRVMRNRRFYGEPTQMEFRVEERWKGDSTESQLMIRLSPTWPTDEIEIREGERSILFLSKRRSDGTLDLVDGGRGRMTTERVGDRHLAVIWVRDVVVPREWRVDEDPDREGLLFGRVEVETLQSLVKRDG